VCQESYQPVQFNWLVYQASSVGPGTPAGDARFGYYDVTGVPTLKFDGTTTVLGGSSDGSAYLPIIADHHAEAVPLMMSITDWDFTVGSAFVDLRLKLLGDLDNIANSYIRIAVVETEVAWGASTLPHTVRALLPDQPLTISGEGQEQVVNLGFSVDAGWNQANLFLLAFAQRDSDRYIFNSTNSQIGPYALVTNYDGPQLKPIENEEAVFGPINLINLGSASDVYDVTLDAGDLPTGWNASLSYDGQSYPDLQLSIASADSDELSVVIDAPSNETGYLTLNIYSQGTGEIVQTMVLGALTGGAEILIVSDDGQAGFASSHYGPILDSTPLSYAIWERSLAAMTGDDLIGYEAVIWTTGANTQSMQASDRTAIDAYLDSGGRFIMAGENLFQGVVGQGSAARNWFISKFQFNYGGTYSGSLDVVGIQDDPVGDGLEFTLTGGNPDRLSLLSGTRPIEVSCIYANDRPAVIRTDHMGYMSVFMSFGLELVPSQEDRDNLLKRSLEWLGVLQLTPVPDAPEALTALLPNRPNPFNPATEIAFSIGTPGPVRLQIFSTRGQLVRVLVDEAMSAGEHSAVWDGRTLTGRPVASGVYFYRLSTPDGQWTRKMSLIK
jgi:hypothetical protein